MKSVVVQAATVAKAIETAWLKAGKPEEFFIRVLQEHTSGFLGFGGQKAKVAFFFKNSHKSDSLFPVVLKQKEYTSFFGNKSLKTPAKSDEIDHDLNKHIPLSSGHTHKKKPQQPHHKNNTQVQQSVVDKKNKPTQAPAHQVKQVTVNHASKAADATAKVNVHAKADVQTKNHAPHVKQHAVAKHSDVTKDALPSKQDAKVQVSLQVPVEKKVIQSQINVFSSAKDSQPSHKVTADMAADAHAKEDLVESIAQALKKVQSQKLVANVSRNKSTDAPIDKVVVDKKPKVMTPKFENYADFMDAQADKAAAKTAAMPAVPVEKIVEIVQPVAQVVAPVQAMPEKPVQSTTSRPKIVIKRRILTTENPGVSGITRSSDKKDESKKE